MWLWEILFRFPTKSERTFVLSRNTFNFSLKKSEADLARGKTIIIFLGSRWIVLPSQLLMVSVQEI